MHAWKATSESLCRMTAATPPGNASWTVSTRALSAREVGPSQPHLARGCPATPGGCRGIRPFGKDRVRREAHFWYIRMTVGADVATEQVTSRDVIVRAAADS